MVREDKVFVIYLAALLSTCLLLALLIGIKMQHDSQDQAMEYLQSMGYTGIKEPAAMAFPLAAPCGPAARRLSAVSHDGKRVLIYICKDSISITEI